MATPLTRQQWLESLSDVVKEANREMGQITEDTPEADSAEMLRWQLDVLNEKHERLKAEYGNLEASRTYLHSRINKLERRIDQIIDHMTVRALREAGLRVTVDFEED